MKNVKKFLVSMLLVVVLSMYFGGTSLAYARENSEFITSSSCSCIDVKGDYALMYFYGGSKEQFKIINCNTEEVLFEEWKEQFFPAWMWRSDSYITESGYVATDNRGDEKSPNYIMNFITGDISEPIYSQIEHISENGYAILKNRDEYGNRYTIYNCIEKTSTVLPSDIVNLWINDGDFIVIYYEDGHSGILNYVTGKVVFESQHSIIDIKNNFVCLEYKTESGDKEEIVDFRTEESVLVTPTNTDCTLMNNNCAIIEKWDYKNGKMNFKYGLINFMESKMIVDFTEDNIFSLSDDYVAICEDETVIFDVNNQEIVAKGPWCKLRFHNDRYLDVWTQYGKDMVVQGLFDIVKKDFVIEPQQVRARRKGEYHNCGIDVYKNFAVIYTKKGKEIVDFE